MGSLTVYFDDPFWVGVFERETEGRLAISRVVFGAEPTDNEIYLFILTRYRALEFKTANVKEDKPKDIMKVGFKKRQRLASKELEKKGISTRSQEAMKKIIESGKEEKRLETKEEREEEKRRRFEQKQEKKKEKHKGH